MLNCPSQAKVDDVHQLLFLPSASPPITITTTTTCQPDTNLKLSIGDSSRALFYSQRDCLAEQDCSESRTVSVTISCNSICTSIGLTSSAWAHIKISDTLSGAAPKNLWNYTSIQRTHTRAILFLNYLLSSVFYADFAELLRYRASLILGTLFLSLAVNFSRATSHMFCSRPRCTLHRIIIVVSIQAELASHLRRVYRHTRADLFLLLCSLFPALDYLYPPRGFFELRGLFHPCGGVEFISLPRVVDAVLQIRTLKNTNNWPPSTFACTHSPLGLWDLSDVSATLDAPRSSL